MLCLHNLMNVNKKGQHLSHCTTSPVDMSYNQRHVAYLNTNDRLQIDADQFNMDRVEQLSTQNYLFVLLSVFECQWVQGCKELELVS